MKAAAFENYSWLIEKVGIESAVEVHDFWQCCPQVWFSAEQVADSRRLESREQVEIFLADERVNYWVIRHQGSIVAAFGSYDWRVLPYYTLVKFKSKLSGSPSRFKTAFAGLADAIITFQEMRKRYTFYFVASTKQFYNRNGAAEDGHSIMRDLIPSAKDYLFTTESFIRKNEISEWSVYNSMIANQNALTDVIIRRASKNFKIETNSDNCG